MAQYAYYKIGNTNTRIKRVGWNNSSFRKVGWNNSVYILESWVSCSAPMTVSSTLYTQGKTIPKANHTYTDGNVSVTTMYNGVIQGNNNYNVKWWETSFSLWDTNNNYTLQGEKANVTNVGSQLVNSIDDAGVSKYTFNDETSQGRGTRFTVWLKAFYGGVSNVQTNSSRSAEVAVYGGDQKLTAEFKFEQETIPTITPQNIRDKYNLNNVIDNVHNSTTRYYFNNPNFIWNTW